MISFIEKAFFNQKKSFGLYNCGMGYSLSINELVEKIILASNKDLKIKNDLSKPDIPTALSLDCSKANKELNWKNITEFSQALNITYSWAKKNI